MSDQRRYPVGRLREFVKDWTHLDRSVFTLPELRRYLDPDEADRAEELQRLAETIEQQGLVDQLSPGEREALRRRQEPRRSRDQEGEKPNSSGLDRPERGELDVPTPEQLAPMRRTTVVGWHERLRETFHGGVDADGCCWIWHNGLGTYGDGESYEEAKADLLAEISDAIDEWRQLTDV